MKFVKDACPRRRGLTVARSLLVLQTFSFHCVLLALIVSCKMSEQVQTEKEAKLSCLSELSKLLGEKMQEYMQ